METKGIVWVVYWLFATTILSINALKPETFEQRLARIFKETRARSEKAAQKTAQLTEQAAKDVGKIIEYQTAVTTQKIKITVENLQRAFAGQPLLPEPNEAYTRAVYHAEKDAGPDDVQPVVSLGPWNEDIIWKNDQKTHILMTSWIEDWAVQRYYIPSLHREFITPTIPGLFMWITAVPELKKFLQNHVRSGSKVSLSDRTKQFLGLPFGGQRRYFVEMWVRPEDIFRPCINPDILNTQCIPDPDSDQLPENFKNLFHYVPHQPEHRKWFENVKRQSYSGDRPFPWTRLGYSYDWGDSPTGVGASEFVIRQGVPVIIHNIIATEDYPYSKSP